MTDDMHRIPEPWGRREFLSAGAAAAVAAILGACGSDSSSTSTASSGSPPSPTDPEAGPSTTTDVDPEPATTEATAGDSSSVIVIGAGPAGMSAAHLLRQRGVDVRVLEAGPTYGGRIRHDRSFTDFPISLGGEWVHVDGEILDEIVNDPDVEVTTELVQYDDDDVVAVVGEGTITEVPLRPIVFDIDSKFVGSSWLDFFETYIVPGISDVIAYDTVIVEVDHGGDRVVLTDASGGVHEADQVVVTVPLKILQRGDITFVPPLETDRAEAIADATIWSGFKAFFEFSEAFYPAAIAFPDSDTEDGQRLLYDAAYGQTTDTNVLGIFTVGDQAQRYQAMSDDEFVADVLAELDAAYDGAASRTYVRHITQNWDDEPFAGAAYLADDASSSITRRLAQPLGSSVFFAGDAYTDFDDWSSVHTAARSAADAVEQLLG